MESSLLGTRSTCCDFVRATKLKLTCGPFNANAIPNLTRPAKMETVYADIVRPFLSLGIQPFHIRCERARSLCLPPAGWQHTSISQKRHRSLPGRLQTNRIKATGDVSRLGLNSRRRGASYGPASDDTNLLVAKHNIKL